MAISGLTPTTALPFAMGTPISGAPLAAQSGLTGNPLLGASAGATEKPGLGTRLLNAMKSAISELRGGSPSASALATAQTLAMQAAATPVASQPVSVSKPAANAKPKFPHAKTWIDKQGNVRELGTGKVLKAAAGAAAAAPASTVPADASQLQTNATQIPGATVYSYDQNGNPIAAPTMQSLGMTPTMLQGLTGMANGVDPDGPQLNATNQTNLGGIGSMLGMGSAVPVLGQPIAVTQPSAGDTGAGTGTGGNQSVTNENKTDVSSRNQGPDYGWGGYGGYGGSGWGLPFGGVATPGAPYGASMTGAYVLGNSANRLF